MASSSAEFQGAAHVASFDKEKGYKCTACKTTYYLNHFMAYLNKNSKEFHQGSDGDLKKVKCRVTDEAWKQCAVADECIELVCYICAGGFHKKTYIRSETNDDGKPKVLLTSEWRNRSQRSKCQLPPSKLKHCLTNLEKHGERKRKAEDANLPPLDEVMAKVADERVAKATDWVTCIHKTGETDIHLIYGCAACGCYPLKSSSWWRMSRSDTPDGTTMHGFWACASCLERWAWHAAGHLRLFVIHCAGSTVLAYIGGEAQVALERKFEQELVILKAAQLLKTLNGHDITEEHLLWAIEELNRKSDIVLMTRLPIQTIKARNPRDKFETCPFSEDHRLSLMTAGTHFKAHVVDHSKEENNIPTLNLDGLQSILHVCAAFVDLTQIEPKGPAQQHALETMKDQVREPHIQDIIERALRSRL